MQNKLWGATFIIALLFFGIVSCKDGNETHTHSLSGWSVKTDVTCTEAKVESRHCSCGFEETRTVGSPLNHNIHWVTVTEPSYIAEGSENGTCQNTPCTHTEMAVPIPRLVITDINWFATSFADEVLDTTVDNPYTLIVNLPNTAIINESNAIKTALLLSANANKFVILDMSESEFTSLVGEIWGAFQDCKNLVGITLPNSLIDIGEFAFYECNNLKSANIPNNITTLGESTFQRTALVSVTIPNNITSIGDLVFADNPSLISVTIPSSVTSMGGSVFGNSLSITSITIPASVTSMGWNVFRGWTSSQSITIPFANEAAADAAWGENWRRNCNAVINYVP